MRPAGTESEIRGIAGIKQRGQIGRRIIDGPARGRRVVDAVGKRNIGNEISDERIEPDPELLADDHFLLAVANNPSTPPEATVAFKAVPTASARNWMQASVPAVGQDVTGSGRSMHFWSCRQ